MMEKADEYAITQVQSLFEPIVQSVASEYDVVIEIQD